MRKIYGRMAKFANGEELVKFLNENIHTCGYASVREFKFSNEKIQIYPKQVPGAEAQIKKLIGKFELHKGETYEQCCYEVFACDIAKMIEKYMEYPGIVEETKNGIYYVETELQEDDPIALMQELVEQALVDSSSREKYLVIMAKKLGLTALAEEFE